MVISSLELGGAERVMSDMANYWARKGWSVSIISITGSESKDMYPLHHEVRRVHLGLTGGTKGFIQKISRNWRKIRNLRNILRADQPDVLISFMDVTNIISLFASHGLNLRLYISERVDPSTHKELGRGWRLLRRILYRRASAVIGQTPEISAWLRDRCHARAVTIPNPLRELPIPKEKREKLVISVGRLVHQKGFDVLLQAFAITQARFPDWRLVILGDGVLRQELLNLAHRLNISSSVEMPGIVHDVEAWMARAGLVVQASRFEGFPNVVMEAMGMGAAVIATDCRSGPSELIQDGENGRLVGVDNVDQLAGAMAELMASPMDRRRLGLGAMDIRKHLAQDKIMSQWETLLAETHPVFTSR